MAKALRQPMLKVFPAALLGRLTLVPYYPLSNAMLKSIIRLQLERIKQRIATNHEAALTYDDAVVDLIATRCTELESGGRMIDAILTQTLLPEISREILSRMMEGQRVRAVRIEGKENDFVFNYETTNDAVTASKNP
jgi:type VI secretion system protein VasG